MSGSTHSILGVVELVNAEASDARSGNTMQILHDAFGHRLNDWLNTHDEWSFLNDNRACVILRDIDTPDELARAAADLDKVFREPHYHLGRALPLTVTAGFTQFDGQNLDLALALQQAGIALDQAKQADHLFEMFSPHDASTLLEEGVLVDEMQAALERDEFLLYYQPKVHAGSRRLIGAEALIRWHHPQHGLIAPDKFIELAARHEVIKPITWWVIQSAVRQLSSWPEQLSIAINLSPTLLLDDEILFVIIHELAVHNITPARLNLEITAEGPIEQQDIMLDRLTRLRSMGVKISLDGFGAGFSELAYIRDLPVDEIKIDQGFVRRMLVSEKDCAMVKSLVELAHNFSLEVVAVGVESIAIADRLAQLRCDMLQGYVFDKPLPAAAFELEYRL